MILKFKIWWGQKYSMPVRLKQQFLKKIEVNQPDILHVDGDSGKINCDLGYFGKLGSSMLWVSQFSRFINKLCI